MWRKLEMVVAVLVTVGLAGCAGMRVPDEMGLTAPSHPVRLHEEMRIRAEEEAVSRALGGIHTAPQHSDPPAPESE